MMDSAAMAAAASGGGRSGVLRVERKPFAKTHETCANLFEQSGLQRVGHLVRAMFDMDANAATTAAVAHREPLGALAGGGRLCTTRASPIARGGCPFKTVHFFLLQQGGLAESLGVWRLVVA